MSLAADGGLYLHEKDRRIGRLMVFPIVLGQGPRLFGDSGVRANLRLAETLRAGECVVLTCEAARVAAPRESAVR